MRKWNGLRRYGGPWYGHDGKRILFEHGANIQFATLRKATRTSGPKAGRLYRTTIEVPYYDARHVEILFSKKTPSLAKIIVDGPTDSPHRYEDNRLCIWHPDDPEDNRWVFGDGLLHLLRLIETHLFREGWWRETGEWCGPEAGHPDGNDFADDAGKSP